ncbi:MAG: CIA30 family protein [Rhodothermales bacterium]
MKSIFTMIFVAFLLTILSQPVEAQDLLLNNAQIVDPAGETITTGSVLIRNGRVSEISSATFMAEQPASFDGEIIDLQGKWLMPGLNDMHTHSYGNMGPSQTAGDFVMTGAVARRMLYAGVTGFLDLFSAEDFIFQLREQKRNGEFPGADIYAAGPILTAPGGHGTEYGIATRTISNPEEATVQVDELANKQPDVIKIVYDNAGYMPTVDKATMTAVSVAAKAHNIPVVAHIGSWDDVRDVISAGIKAITHTPRGEIPEDIIALMKAQEVLTIPTLAVQTEFSRLVREPAALDNSLLAAVTPPELLDSYRDTSAYDPRFKGFLVWQEGMRADIFASVNKLAKAGIPVLTGTDAGNPGVFQGFSVHREMELLVEAGLSPWQALASATTLAGDLVGQSFGVRKGDLANFIVLNTSPVEDIRNTQDIDMVIQRGELIDRDGLLDDKAVAVSGTTASFEGPLIDDFSEASLMSSLGISWIPQTDKVMGGNSTLVHSNENGVLKVNGSVKPSSGRPGFASFTLQLNSAGKPMDISSFDGVEIQLNVTKGGVGLQLMTPQITNYDYHGKLLMPTDGMQVVKIPFDEFQQMWSAQMPWTGKDVFAIALMVSNFQQLDFAYEIDSIGFYKE